VRCCRQIADDRALSAFPRQCAVVEFERVALVQVQGGLSGEAHTQRRGRVTVVSMTSVLPLAASTGGVSTP
jgi:hypothetical protein